MSQSGKRDAQQAFGTEAASKKNESPNKKNRRRRSEKSSRHENGSAQELALRSPAKDDKRTPKGKVQKQEPAELEQQSINSPKSTQKERKQSSPQPEAKPQTHVDDQESPQGSKKRQRSKRNHKPKFDQNTSQIELVLARAGELSSADDENEAPPSSKKKGMSDNRHRQREPEKHSPSKKHLREKSLTRKSRSPHDWTLSRPVGGAFIDHDPVLTPDQQFLILATKQNVEVYSTKTSLLVRTIHVTKRAAIVSYTQILSQEQYLVVGLSDGSLSKYDWTTGKRIWTISFNGSITAITSTSSSTTEEAFLMINNNEDGTYHMTSLTVDQNGKQTGRRSLLTQKSLIKPQICFSAELGVVVVSSKDTIMVGKLGDESGKEAVSVKWCDISTIGGKIVCFDAQILPSRKQSKKVSVEPTVNIAVGLRSGEIHVYSDVLNTNVGQGSDLHVRRLHWHRAAPRTVKFSPDSNYLISGGDETVLVIWQLDTNQKQVLPHLTSSILNATVATQGSAYALRLADNSIMVLSTSDLQPFANVSNLAVDASSRAPFLSGVTAPAALHPNHMDRLLLAYSLQNGNYGTKRAEKSSNMVQTYDIAAQLQLSRQALARNLASTVNIGPSGQSLTEPDVTHLDISHDGKWLVTVDQWSPSNDDLDKLYLSRGDQSSRVQLNECFLRFWSTNNLPSESGTDLWELNTRIDEPISTDISLKKRAILAMAVSPVRPQVVIADSNRHLKIFSPKARIRSGVPVRDANGQQLFTWTCDHEMSLQETSQGPEPEFATLAFSEDGSVLAASWSSNSYLKARVHLIEPKAATKVASLPDVVTHGHAQLAFCGQYLIGLSEKFCVFDTVTMQQTFSIEIDKKFDHKSRMAANMKSGVVAVAVSERAVRSPSHLILFDVRAGYGKRPLLEEVVHSQVHILLAEKDRGGFLIVDGEGRTIKVCPPGSALQSLVVREELPEKKIVRSSLDNVFGTSQKKPAPVVKQDADGPQKASLEDVFRFESSAQAPPTKDLFNQVALVVAGAAA